VKSFFTILLMSFPLWSYSQLSDIVAAEYFFDSDPGIGAATALPAFTTNPNLDVTFLAASSGLSEGMHILGIRVQDNTTTWSIPLFLPVYILAKNPTLDGAEYFFDTDPGFGNATPITIAAGATIDVTFAANSAALSVGMHALAVRTRNANGDWDIPVYTPFYIDQSRTITKLEYFFDMDPGSGNGAAIAVSPATDVLDQVYSMNSSALTIGSHNLNVRVAGQNNFWGIPESFSFSVTAALPPTITSFNPTSGPIGTIVTITGTNFSATPANNIVFFGATKAMVNAATSTQLTVTVPTGATYQPISVLVDGLTAYSKDVFIVTFSGAGAIDACSFEASVNFLATASLDDGLAVCDLDADGKVDLITNSFNGANTINHLSLYRNTSTFGSINASSFSSSVNFITPERPTFVAAGDLNGDGKPELIVVNRYGNSVSVFKNISTIGTIDASSFASKIDFATGLNPDYVALADLDLDGKPEIIVTNYSGRSISVYRNITTTGNIDTGSFAARVDFDTGAGTGPYGLAIADLDSDGKPDMVIADDARDVISIFKNTSIPGTINATSLAAKVEFATGRGPEEVRIGDLDGDSKPDIAVCNWLDNDVSVFRNTTMTGVIDVGSFAPAVEFLTGQTPDSMEITDVDGDGKPDLIVPSSSVDLIAVLRNTSTPGAITASSFAPKVDFLMPNSASKVVMGDFDGDGKPDMAALNYANDIISILRNTIVPPAITSVTPSSGNIGSSVTITGTNFSTTPANNLVRFNGVAATVTASSATSITTSVPVGATTGKIQVTVGCNTAISIIDFTIGSITITSDPGGTYERCEGTSLTLSTDATGTTNITYQWQKFNSGTSLYENLSNGGVYAGVTSKNLTISTIQNAQAGDYRCMIQGDLTSPVYTNIALLVVNSLPPLPTVTNGERCGPGQVVLTASGASPGEFIWYNDPVAGEPIPNENDPAYTTPILSATTTFYVSIVNSFCESARIAVTANIVSTTAPTVTSTSNCGPGSVTLVAAGATNGQYRWYDLPTGGTALAGEFNNNFTTPVLTTTTTYYVSINNGSCESTRTAVVATILTVPPKPTITSNEPINAGIVELCLKAITLSAPSGFTYTWSNGQTTQQITNLQPGTYSVVVKDASGCSSVSSDIIQVMANTSCVNNPPVINTTTVITTIGGFVSINLTPFISDPDNNLDPASLQVVGNATQRGGKTSLSGFTLDIDYSGNNFSGDDLVTIRICDQLSVCIEKQFAIEVIGDINVFNGISPNGDGKNDFWVIEYIDLFPDTQTNRVTLYNRWGDVVWEASDYDNTSVVFTGINKNGNELSTGSYFYKIEFEGGREPITGYLSLKR
jgi:gliding motility-associated-like protein